MTYLIDAWLDRPQPYLRILNRDTGAVCAVLEEEALDELRDQGDLDLGDVAHHHLAVIQPLAFHRDLASFQAGGGVEQGAAGNLGQVQVLVIGLHVAEQGAERQVDLMGDGCGLQAAFELFLQHHQGLGLLRAFPRNRLSQLLQGLGQPLH